MSEFYDFNPDRFEFNIDRSDGLGPQQDNRLPVYGDMPKIQPPSYFQDYLRILRRTAEESFRRGLAGEVVIVSGRNEPADHEMAIGPVTEDGFFYSQDRTFEEPHIFSKKTFFESSLLPPRNDYRSKELRNELPERDLFGDVMERYLDITRNRMYSNTEPDFDGPGTPPQDFNKSKLPPLDLTKIETSIIRENNPIQKDFGGMFYEFQDTTDDILRRGPRFTIVYNPDGRAQGYCLETADGGVHYYPWSDQNEDIRPDDTSAGQ